MKKYVLVLLALAACKTPAADPAPPKAQETAAARPAPQKTEPPPATAEPAPAPPEKVDATPRLLVAIERTPCFGRCPIYRAELFDDGTLVFDGKRFTSAQGRHETKLSKDKVDAVVARLEESDFASWKATYEHMEVTDMPGAKVTFREKTISHYHGDRSAPEALTTLENELDALLGIQPWIQAKPSDR